MRTNEKKMGLSKSLWTVLRMNNEICIVLNHAESCQIVPNRAKLCRIVPNRAESCRIVPYCTMPNGIGPCRAALSLAFPFFRCYEAPLYEGLSVRPSVRTSVTPSLSRRKKVFRSTVSGLVFFISVFLFYHSFFTLPFFLSVFLFSSLFP